MTPYYILRVVGEGGWRPTMVVSKNQRTIVVSKNYRIVEVGKVVSLPPSLSLQSDMGMGEPHSLFAKYVSAERQTCDHDWY